MNTPLPALSPGVRVYAIGDVHGCLEALKQLLVKVEKDAAVATIPVRKIFLGDYVDRGLYSKQTIDFLLDWKTRESEPPIFLKGNHEQVMLDLLTHHDGDLLRDWFNFGGRETLMSYGINPALASTDQTSLFEMMRDKVPRAHIDFLNNLELTATFGDYFFCHAGVRPGIDLAAQKEEDLVWIRDEFLNYAKSFGKVVVHGHTISHQAEFMPNRIGIDTGAYATGRLTALGLEGTKRWLVQTG